MLKFSILEVVTRYWLPTSGAQIPQRLIFTTAYSAAEFRVKKQIASLVNDEGTNDLIVNVGLGNNKEKREAVSSGLVGSVQHTYFVSVSL